MKNQRSRDRWSLFCLSLGNTEAVETSPAAKCLLGTKKRINRNLAGATGLEPAASCVTGRRSTLSEPACIECRRELAG